LGECRRFKKENKLGLQRTPILQLDLLHLIGQIYRSPGLNISWATPGSDGSRSKFFDPGQVGSAIYGLGLDLENFP